jgi:hypothetical protein
MHRRGAGEGVDNEQPAPHARVRQARLWRVWQRWALELLEACVRSIQEDHLRKAKPNRTPLSCTL